MKAGWELRTIGDFCEVIAGQSPESKFYNGDSKGMPFYQGKKDFGDKFINLPNTWTTEITKTARKNDILMSIRAPVGPVNFATQDICIGRGLAAIRSKGLLNVDFLFYQLLYLQPRISGKEGAVFASINKSEISGLPIAYTNLSEQQRIVAILDEAFEAIAAARANAEQNRQNARALFESYLQSVFSQRGEGWVDSGNVLSSMCELIVDCEHKTAPTQDEGFPSIRTPNIGKGKLLLDDVKRVSEETYRAWTRRAVPLPGDLIFAREAPAGNVAVVPDGLQPCLGQRTVLIRPKKEAFDSLFLTYLLLSPSMQEHLLSHSKGSTVQHINMKDIRALRLGGIPAIKEQRELARRITDCSMNCERLESLYQRKIEALDELKQSLLQQAFSGNL